MNTILTSLFIQKNRAYFLSFALIFSLFLALPNLVQSQTISEDPVADAAVLDPSDLREWSDSQNHPIGTLIEEEGVVYQITPDGKQGFPSVSIFRSYGHRFEDIVPASSRDRQLPAVETATYADGDLLVDDGTVYIMHDRLKYAFRNREAFEGLGYSFDNVFPGELDLVPVGGLIEDDRDPHRYGTVVNVDGALYVVIPRGRILIPSMRVFAAHKYRLGRVVAANTADRELPVVGQLDYPAGTLVSIDGTIHLFGRQRAMAFDSAETFFRLGYRFDSVVIGHREDLDRADRKRYILRSIDDQIEDLPGDHAFTIKKIENLESRFQLSSFPETPFVLEKVIRVDGLQAGGCNSGIPGAVKEEVRISNGCFDESVFDPDTDYSLIGVDIKVSNNSNIIVSGDLIKLVYFIGSEDDNILRFAQRDIDFSSYSVASYEDRLIRMSFWVPSEHKVLYLGYGLKSTTQEPLLFGEKLRQNFEGSFQIDFNTSQVVTFE